MPSPLFNVRPPRLDDANELLDIDIKCFENPWSAQKWSKVVSKHNDYFVSVATYFGSPIGLAVFRQHPDSLDIEIEKIAVLRPHRRKGASLYLLAAAVTYAQTTLANNLFIIVPESTVYPVGPDKPSQTTGWLSQTGFLATKPFLKNHFHAYGTVEDGVKFTAPIRRSAAA